MADEDLKHILSLAVSKNAECQISGMLLYVEGKFINRVGGRFIQVLEGNEKEVRAIFSKIKKDPRHYEVTLLNECATKNRNFPAWTMGFRSLNLEEFKSMPAYFELDDSFMKSKSTNVINVPLTFLKSFYGMNLIDFPAADDINA